MDSIRKHIDLFAALAAVLWVMLYEFVPALEVLGSEVSTPVAMAFGSAAFLRWRLSMDTPLVDLASGVIAIAWVVTMAAFPVDLGDAMGSWLAPEAAASFAFVALTRFYATIKVEGDQE